MVLSGNISAKPCATVVVGMLRKAGKTMQDEWTIELERELEKVFYPSLLCLLSYEAEIARRQSLVVWSLLFCFMTFLRGVMFVGKKNKKFVWREKIIFCQQLWYWPYSDENLSLFLNGRLVYFH